MNYRSRNILTSEEAQKFAEAMAKINWKSNEEREAFAETITRELREDIERDDMLSTLGVDVQTFGEGQTIEFITRKGLKAYVHEPGSYAPRSTITNKTQTLTTEMVSVNVEMELGQLRSGRYGTVQDIRTQALEALQGRKNAYIWTTLIGSIASTDSNYFSVASAGTVAQKKAALDSGMNYVADQQGSEVVAIVGRRTALEWVADYSAYNTYGPSEGKKGELDSNIYPATYRGIPIVYLNQYKDSWNANVINSTNIMVLGRDTLKLGVTRPLDFEQGMDSNTLMWNIHFYEKYGLGVFFPTRNARIALT